MRELLRRAWYAIRKSKLDAELAEEMDFHRAMKAQELEARGVDAGEADFAARDTHAPCSSDSDLDCSAPSRPRSGCAVACTG
jgi:hypothetical protein